MGCNAQVKKPTRNSWENVKYPHTPYLQFSPSVDKHDIRDSGYFDLKNFSGKPLTVTVKMDGSNALLTSTGVAARNASTAEHKSFDLLKAMHAPITHLIPEGVQVFGEWLYAKHSIHYTGALRLPALFQVFAVYRRQTQMWLGWNEVQEYARKIGFITVPTINTVQEENTQKLAHVLTQLGNDVIKHGQEGIVVRNTHPFHYGQFQPNIAKYVRPNHVTTDTHWSMQRIIRNEITST